MASSLQGRQSLTTCYFCQHYRPVGRRGGHCQMMNVPVESSWSACSLAHPIFEERWERSTGLKSTKSPQGAGKIDSKSTGIEIA